MQISRRALSVWARWREAPHNARVQLMAWAGLSAHDVYVLERLSDNLRRCGDECEWFPDRSDLESHLRRKIAPTLCYGLTLAPEDARRLAGALCLQTPGRAMLVTDALIAFACSTVHAPEPMQEAEQQQPPPECGTVYERILEAVEHYGFDCRERLRPGMREAIAARCGTTEENVVTYMSRLRKERGCQIQTKEVHNARDLHDLRGGDWNFDAAIPYSSF